MQPTAQCHRAVSLVHIRVPVANDFPFVSYRIVVLSARHETRISSQISSGGGGGLWPAVPEGVPVPGRGGRSRWPGHGGSVTAPGRGGQVTSARSPVARGPPGAGDSAATLNDR